MSGYDKKRAKEVKDEEELKKRLEEAKKAKEDSLPLSKEAEPEEE